MRVSLNRMFVKMVKPFVERFPRLAIICRTVRDSWDTVCEPRMTPMGFKLIGNSVMEAGDFEKLETEWVRRIIKDMDVFINVGANVGYYCCLALAECNSSLPIIAFEPVATNFDYLKRNVIANGGDSNVELFPLALGDQVGVVKIYGGGVCASTVEGWEGINKAHYSYVPVNTLDNVIGNRFDAEKCFFLVDVEGAEFSVLKGALSVLLRNPKPVWMIEICVKEHQPAGVELNPDLLAIFDLFWNTGYEVWTVGEAPHRVSRPEIELIVERGIDTLGTHNFIFASEQWCQQFFSKGVQPAKV
jgi:FkbM family methyltransferase